MEIAGTVSSACQTFDEISGYKDELKFLYQFYEAKVKEQKSIEKNILEDAIKSFEKANNIILKQEGIYFKRWISEKDNQIEISNINFYFKPFLDCWEDFEFITAFKIQKKIERKGLHIDKER